MKALALLLLVCLCGVMLLPLVSADVTSGLIGHWKFDEGVGTSLDDSSGFSADGTLTGGSWSSGKFGNAVNFSAGTEHGDVSLSGDLAGDLSQFTASCWLNLHDNVRDKSGGCFERGSYNTAGNIGMEVYVGDIYYDVYFQGAGWQGGGVYAVPLNEWHLFVLVYNGSVVSFYRDNAVLLSTKSVVSDYVLANSNLKVGFVNDAYLNGTVDDLRFYDRALSVVEVQDLFVYSHVVTVSGESHASVSPLGSNVVNYGGDLSVTFVPNYGYYVDSVIVDGVDLGGLSSPYVFSNVTDDESFGLICKAMAGNVSSFSDDFLVLWVVLIFIVVGFFMMVLPLPWLPRFVFGVLSLMVCGVALGTTIVLQPYIQLTGLLMSVMVMLVAAVKGRS